MVRWVQVDEFTAGRHTTALAEHSTAVQQGDEHVDTATR